MKNVKLFLFKNLIKDKIMFFSILFFVFNFSIVSLIRIVNNSSILDVNVQCDIKNNVNTKDVNSLDKFPIRFPITFHVNPKNIDQKDIESIKYAAQVWNKYLNKKAIVLKISNNFEKNSKNKVSEIFFERNEWTRQSSEQGYTSSFYYGDYILESDIIINNFNYSYYNLDKNNLSSYIPNKVNLESLMIHEFGHALGLGHVDYTLMDPTLALGTNRINLTSKDLDYLKCKYPKFVKNNKLSYTQSSTKE